MRHLKSILLGLGLLVVSGLVFSGMTPTFAQTVKTGDSVTVPVGETVDSVLFVGGNSLDIAGTVNGDVYCGGQNVTISGTVNGDVFCAAQTINISGKVDGSVRLASQTVTLGGAIAGDVTVASQTLVIQKDSTIGRDLVGGVQSVSINGSVGRDLAVGAETLTINGSIGRNVKGDVQTLTVGSTGVINGDAIYSSNTSPVINSGGQINGIVTRMPLEQKSMASSAYAPFEAAFASFVYVFVTMLILALVVAVAFPAFLQHASSKALKSPGRTSLIGFASVILVPALIFILLISVIGTPLGLVVLLGWLVVVLLSGSAAGYVLGRVILKDTKKPVVTMLLGVSILLILCFVPFVGLFVMLAIYIFGIGVLLPELSARFTQSALNKS